MDYALQALNHAATLRRDPVVSAWLDCSLVPPAPFGQPAGARLIVLGQDPTVKRAASRSRIRTVLNLDRESGALFQYIAMTCELLGVGTAEIYATNAVNCFFTQPPASIRDRGVLRRAFELWLPLLASELAQAPETPVLTLGEPVLQLIARPGTPNRVAHYWGFARKGAAPQLAVLSEDQNVLGRMVFPFPHQPSYKQKNFYLRTHSKYCHYVRGYL